MKKKILSITIPSALVFMAVAIVMISSAPKEADANPTSFLRKQTSTVATTTRTYLSPGLGTTTLTFDVLAAGAYAVEPVSPVLAIQGTASSTTSILSWRYEYSQDGIDWYGDNVSALATTTADSREGIYVTHRWDFASTSLLAGGDVGTASGQRQMKMVGLSVPTRFVRAVFYVPVGAGNVALWAEFIAQKQQK